MWNHREPCVICHPCQAWQFALWFDGRWAALKELWKYKHLMGRNGWTISYALREIIHGR